MFSQRETEENVMEIRYGLISADSHVVTDKNAFVERMSKSKWGERIPQVVQVDNQGQTVDRWAVYGKAFRGRGVCNCPAVMGDPLRNSYPQRWEDVPAKAYLPGERLKGPRRGRCRWGSFVPQRSRLLPSVQRPRVRACLRASLQRFDG